MHIYSITMKNFKSYRDFILVEYLDPTINLIIGENGHGKSNFMDAILFVLTDKYSNLRHEDKKQLVHEEIGEEIKEIFVELVMDNKERKIPIDKDLIKIKKVYHVQENYEAVFINDKKFLKNEFDNILESSGFTQQNPYFIIQQGKINNFINMTDLELYNVFSELTGMKIFEEKKTESENYLKDASNDIQKIQTKKNEIEIFIEKLSSQKNDLIAFDQLERNKKVFHEIIFSEKLTEIQKFCDILEDNKIRLNEDFQKKLIFLTQIKFEQNCENKEIENFEKNFISLKKKIIKCDEEISELKNFISKENATIEAFHLNLNEENLLENFENLKFEENEKNKISKNLEILKKEIFLLEEEIKKNEEEINFTEKEYKKFLSNLEILNLKSTNEFKNEDNKKNYIETEIKKFEENLKNLFEEIYQIEIKVENEQKNYENLANKNSENEKEKIFLEKKLEEKNVEITHKQKLRVDNVNLMKMREIEVNDCNEKINYLNEDCKNLMRSIPNYDVLKAVKEIEENLKNNEMLKDKIIGVLIDLIEIDDKFTDAVDLIAKDKLYSIIVKDFQIAEEIIKINSLKKGPVISIQPLDWNINNINNPNWEINPQENNKDAVPLMKFITIKEEIKTKYINQNTYQGLFSLINKIFGKTFLVRNYEIGLKIAKEKNINCITKENEIIFAGAYLTKIGGNDNEKKRFINYKKLNKNFFEKKISENLLEKFQQEKLNKLNQENQSVRELQIQQTEKKEILKNLENFIQKEKNEKEEIKNSLDFIANLELRKKKLENNKQENENKLKKYKEVLSSQKNFENFLMKNPQEIKEEKNKFSEIKELLTLKEKELITFEKKRKILFDKKSEKEKDINSLLNKKEDIELKKKKEKNFAIFGESENNINSNLGNTSAKKIIDSNEKEFIEAQISAAENEIKKYISYKQKLKFELVSLENKKEKIKENNENKEKEIKIQVNEISLIENKLKNTILNLEENSEKKNSLVKKIANLGKIDQAQKNEYLELIGKNTKSKKKKKEKNENLLQMDIENEENNSDIEIDIDKKMKKIEKNLQPIFKKLFEANKKLEKFKKINKFVEDDLNTFIKKNEEITEKLEEQKFRQEEIRAVISSLEEKQENSIIKTFEKVRESFKLNFNSLVPNGHGDLELYEESVGFSQKNSKNLKKMIAITANFSGEKHNKQNMNQLSGGQKTIVVISLIFALSQVDKPPFYILDEIDAALDYQMRKNFAQLIKEFSKNTQFLISTFKSEILEVAEQIYKVKFSNKTSYLNKITKNEAWGFISEINSTKANK